MRLYVDLISPLDCFLCYIRDSSAPLSFVCIVFCAGGNGCVVLAQHAQGHGRYLGALSLPRVSYGGRWVGSLGLGLILPFRLVLSILPAHTKE